MRGSHVSVSVWCMVCLRYSLHVARACRGELQDWRDESKKGNVDTVRPASGK